MQIRKYAYRYGVVYYIQYTYVFVYSTTSNVIQLIKYTTIQKRV